MNRNDPEINERNRSHSGRQNPTRKKAGSYAGDYAEEYTRDSRREPEHLKSRERMRHDHDQNFTHDLHNRDKSFRARLDEEDEFRRHLEDSGWSDTPGEEPLEESLARYTYSEYPQFGHNFDRHKLRHRDFTGMGPRGYKRSDARIEEDVCELLSRDHYIDASDIVVAVENGIVKLSGSVKQREDRVEAEMLAENVIGVEDIQNDISVKRKSRETSAESEHGRTH